MRNRIEMSISIYQIGIVLRFVLYTRYRRSVINNVLSLLVSHLH